MPKLCRYERCCGLPATYRDAIARIQEYAPADQQTFLATTLLQDAIIRNLEVIGEAVKQLPPSIRQRHPTIPWTQIAGMRDMLIHKYFGVDLTIVWNVVQTDLPPLQHAALVEIAAATSQSESEGRV